MDRLTEQCWRNLVPWECCGQDHYCLRSCYGDGGCLNGCIVPKVYHRLAAYEDTGLEPEEIVALTVEPPNNPLTLEELRARNGKPIWSESLDGSMQSKWMICTYYMYDLKLYGKKWVAYLREPGEGTV